jgi:alkylhydroperoxidase/carboxymuconolactone decarboxylase family protein YurZ
MVKLFIRLNKEDIRMAKSNYVTMVHDTEAGKLFHEVYAHSEKTSVLGPKVYQLVFIAYLASHGIVSGVRKHTKEAKKHGARKEEIQAVFQAGLTIGGASLADSYVAAMESYDES